MGFEITANWLGHMLEIEGPMAQLSVTRIGEAYGFASRIYRVAWLEDGIKRSVDVKIWPLRRDADRDELRFFQRFAEVGIKIPRYDNGYVDHQNNQIVLILEDMHLAQQGDVLVNLDRDRALRLAQDLATMHARWEGALETMNWLGAPLPWWPNTEWLRSRQARLVERFGDHLPKIVLEQLALVESLPPRVNEILLPVPHTLIHGDFHLDNLLFEKDNRPILLDWSRPQKGAGVLNVAELLFDMLPERLILPTVEAYLGRYNDLSARQISYDQLMRQVQAAFWHKFVTATCGIALWEPDEPRGAQIIQHGFEQMAQALRFWKTI